MTATRKISVQAENRPEVLTFHFFEQRVLVTDQFGQGFSINREDWLRIVYQSDEFEVGKSAANEKLVYTNVTDGVLPCLKI